MMAERLFLGILNCGPNDQDGGALQTDNCLAIVTVPLSAGVVQDLP